ncbi:MAG TPA: MFS transporter, partial [Pyrinomonadaceae bacterium]|nr:MFS transporter [Pyrinomonadaceae bacterium]
NDINRQSKIENQKYYMDSLTYTQLLRRNRSFRRLWIGQVISELGNWFNFIAVLGLVRVVSNAAPEVTTIVLIVRLVPFTLFAPLAGAFVDRWSRRKVMIATDLLRVAVALGPLFIRRPQDLWIAYVCTALLSFFGTFFEAAKNAAVPNITGERDLLAGNALMFSSRFLLMSLGAALGGWTAAHVGYSAAFIINALSFFASAYSVWLVPEEETKQRSIETAQSQPKPRYTGYWSDIREGWSYIVTHAPVATILGINIIWAVGGGASNLIADRLGALVFAGENGISPDSAVAALYFANGMGLFLGMLIARRVGAYFELKQRTIGFIGWSLLAQGIVFGLSGVMPALWLACALLLVSRVMLGAEFAVQETLLMRLVPDNLRGRVSTTDRAGEMLIWTFSTGIAGWSLRMITPRTLTVIAGFLSGLAGIVWLVLFASQAVRLPRRLVHRLD